MAFITRKLLYLIPLLNLARVCGFVPPTSTSRNIFKSTSNLRAIHPEISNALSSSSHYLSSLLVKQIDADNAKAQFFFLFGAGSGAGGIGLAQLPKITKELSFIKILSEAGPSEGGETINTNPVVSLLYPKKLSVKDVQKAIAKIPSAAKINA